MWIYHPTPFLPLGVDTSNLQVVHTPSGPQLLQTSPEDGDTRHMHDSSMMPVSSAEESDMEEGYMPGESQQVQMRKNCFDGFNCLVYTYFFYKHVFFRLSMGKR